MRPVICAIPVAGFILAVYAFTAQAATIHVPADQLTIQAGIEATSYGDLVLVAPGTYKENIDFLGNVITVKSEGGAEVTVIEGDKTTSVVAFTSSETEDTAIEGFFIRNGIGSLFYPSIKGNYGGGIYCYNSSPSIVNCIISENGPSDYGGGISCWESSPKINNCTIMLNNGSQGGGGIYCRFSDPRIFNCSIIGNNNEGSSGVGGGIHCYDSNPIIDNCTISENGSPTNNNSQGGGIYCYYSYPTVKNSIISSNFADKGGGFYCRYSSPYSAPRIENSVISNNSASGYYGYGGGIYCGWESSLEITNCTISDNIAGEKGGGIKVAPFVKTENCII